MTLFTLASKMPQYCRRHATGTLMLVTKCIWSRSSWGMPSYRGTTTRQPISRARSAWGKEPATSANPPVAEKGSASLAQNRTFILVPQCLSAHRVLPPFPVLPGPPRSEPGGAGGGPGALVTPCCPWPQTRDRSGSPSACGWGRTRCPYRPPQSPNGCSRR